MKRLVTAIGAGVLLAGMMALAGGWMSSQYGNVTTVVTTVSINYTNATGMRMDLQYVTFGNANMTNGTIKATSNSKAVTNTLVSNTTATDGYVSYAGGGVFPLDPNEVILFSGIINTSGTGQANVTNTSRYGVHSTAR